jgi:hypothetical protein
MDQTFFDSIRHNIIIFFIVRVTQMACSGDEQLNIIERKTEGISFIHEIISMFA